MELQEALDKIDELQNQVEAGKKEKEEPQTRKMVFPTTGFGGGHVTFDQSDFEKMVKTPQPRKPEELTFEELALASMICEANDKIGGIADVYRERLESLSREKFGASFYTMTSTGAATGEELKDVGIMGALWRDTVLAAKVANLFDPIVNMPTNPFDIPVMGDVTFYKPAGEGQAVTATNLATGKRTLTAYTVKAQVDVSDELNQDAVIALIPQIRARLVENGAREIDKLILCADTEDGSTGNINSDDTAPAGTESYMLGFDGIIKYALVTNSGQAADLDTLTIEDFATLLGLLDGKYVADPSRLAWISDPWVYLKALTLSDFRTVDKLGAKATLLTGQVGAVYNIPYVPTDALVKVDDDGKYTTTSPSTNDTDGRLVLVHRDMWRVGVRQPTKVATERSELKGMTSLVVSFRLALVPFNASGAHTACGYNITV